MAISLSARNPKHRLRSSSREPLTSTCDLGDDHVMFNAQRISIARLRRRLSVRDLAAMLDMDPRRLRLIERGERDLPQSLVDDCANALEFPVDFFQGPDIICAEHDEVSYRARRSITSSTQEAMRAVTGIALIVSEWMSDSFNLPATNLPDLSEFSPSVAAAVLREEWQLGSMAIRNVAHLLEANGVRVFSINEATDDVDAFSFFREGVPFVFLNSQKSAARSRFDACHELGHLVLHRNAELQSPEVEKQADEFASAFLMPEEILRTICRKNASVDEIVTYKRDWNVSVAALNYRLHDIGIIDDWTYRANCITISKRGWRKNEPEDRPRERSLVWEKIASRLRASGRSLEDVAQDISIPVSELKSFAAGMIMMSADGMQGNPSKSSPVKRGAPWLRVVEGDVSGDDGKGHKEDAAAKLSRPS